MPCLIVSTNLRAISRFTADIAHDLRTPVNNIRGEAEVALARARTVEEYRDVLESSLEEVSPAFGSMETCCFCPAESPLDICTGKST